MNRLEEILGIKFPKEITISHVTNNSKKVEKNSIFFALQGTKHHGSRYISQAIENGASLVLHDDPQCKTEEINIIFVEDLNKRTLLEGSFCMRDDELVEAYSQNTKIYQFLKEFYSQEKGVSLGHEFIGFTGTNGKTTSAYFCHQILTNLGADSVYIGTLGFQYKNQEFNNLVTSKTTPDIFELYEIFSLIDCQVQYVCIELSSHALEQERLKIPFANVSFMNIGNDHLDYHKSIENYANAKLKAFDLTRNYHLSSISKEHRPKVPEDLNEDIDIYEDEDIVDEDNHERRCLINIDSFLPNNVKDKIYMPINSHIADNEEWKLPIQVLRKEDANNLQPVITISRTNSGANYFYKVIKKDISHAELHIIDNNNYSWLMANSKKITYKFTCNIFPEFNITNLVFSLVSIIQLMNTKQSITWGCSDSGRDLAYEQWHPHRYAIGSKIPNDLNFIKLPKGRVDLIQNIDKNIIIDYAHNSEAFSLLLISMKNYFDNLVVVFGCGGDRDKSKRSEMLKVAIKNSSKVIFTSDNSRSESFEEIFKDASHNNVSDEVIVIEDRKEAIIHGSKLIGDNDCMLILGKGHEENQEKKGKVIPFSDYEVVYEIYS